MRESSRDKPSSLYPKAKTPDEIRVERRRRQLQQQPRQVELKFATLTVSIVFVIKCAYLLISHTMISSLDSKGAVIVGVSVSLGLVMLAGAIILYSCFLINALATRVAVNLARLRMVLASIVIVAAIISLTRGLLVSIIILAVTFVLSHLVTRYYLKQD